MLILILFICGWAAGARIALRHRMNGTVCTGNRARSIVEDNRTDCVSRHRPDCQTPLGQLRDRTITDGLWALAVGLAWPALIAAAAITRTTPATPGETRRRLEQQENEIKRLTAIVDNRETITR